MTDDSMPPRLECEFDFNLPHGTGTEETQMNNASLEDAPMPDRDLDALFVGDPDDEQQPMNYETFPSGFSDDEGGEAAFDRSWAAQPARKLSPKNKKSPRRSDGSDGGEEASPKTKRSRKSLFGGPFEEVDDIEDKDDMSDTNLEVDDPEASKPDIRHRISSLNLDQRQVEKTFNTRKILGHTTWVLASLHLTRMTCHPGLLGRHLKTATSILQTIK
jgi:hypothetical protein